MTTLDLYKIHQILNTISLEQSNLSEKDIFVSLLGHHSEYLEISFTNFLEYYSFKVEDNTICIFNNDGVSYESYNNNDYSFLPAILLEITDEELNTWMKVETAKQVCQQKTNKLQEIENKKLEIERLQKEVNNFGVKN